MEFGFKVKSPANIALIKYWGRQDEKKVLPANVSFSFNLSECFTVSEFKYGSLTKDEYEFEGESNALEYITWTRDYFAKKGVMLPFVKVKSTNNFETAIGLASSASAYSALGFGLCEIVRRFGYEVSESELIEVVRMSGSASAVRSLKNNFVAYDPTMNELFEIGEFDLVDVTCVLNDEVKEISSKEGHVRALSSPWFEERVQNCENRFEKLRLCLENADYSGAFELINEETWSFLLNHYSTEPVMQYLSKKSLDLVRKVKESGLKFAYTFDAGSTVHIICRMADAELIRKIVEPDCIKFYVNKPTKGTSLVKISS